MYEIKKKKDGTELLIDLFYDISSLYQYVSTTDRRSTADESSDENDFYFTGTYSLNEAYKLLINGDEKLFNKIKDEHKKIDIERIIGNISKRKKQEIDVVGYVPNIDNYLKGIPKNMYNQKNNSFNSKILNIVIDGSVSAGIDKDSIIRVGSLYSLIIDMLEKKGYRCNLYMADMSYYNGNIYSMITRIKTDSERFNLKKMAFPMAHPSFFRRIGFKWIESCNIGFEPTHSGYGRPLGCEKTTDEIKKILENELKMKLMLWRVQDDTKVSVTIENIIERLKADGIVLTEE